MGVFERNVHSLLFYFTIAEREGTFRYKEITLEILLWKKLLSRIFNS